MRQLHEMLVHLLEVERRAPDPDARAARLEIEALTAADAETLLTADIDGVLARVGRLLADASTRVRRRWPDAADRSHADLAGRRLTGDLRGCSLRGAVLIRADLRDALLDETDLLGADLRDADLRGTDLSTALFLTQPQVNAASGDAATVLPAGLTRPGHWT
jgi:uncharacterized protein YjbI with pentapeptide repeats